MKHEIVFLDTKETEKFLDTEIYNPTCMNWMYEPFMFEFMKQPLANHNIDLCLKPFDQIDKTKTWFIDLPMYIYSWNHIFLNTNKTLFDCFPKEILDECISGNAFMVYNNQNETDTDLHFKHFYNLYNKNPQVPLNKVIYLSPCKGAKKRYLEWCRENNIPKSNRFTVSYCNHIDLRFNEFDVKHWTQELEVPKTKLFINLNRVCRPQRIFMVAALAELGLLEKGNVSLWYEGDKDSFFNELSTRKQLFLSSKQGKDLYDLIHSGMNKIVDRLPLFLDIKDKKVNPAGFANSDFTMYRESYFNVTSTTFFFKWQEPCYGWNEKEWKPVLARQPFILFSRPGALQAMKDFGIVTYGKYIDETYDLLDDDVERFWAILNELLRLSHLSSVDLDKIIEQTKLITKYNLEYTNTKRWENVFYTGGLKDFIGYI